MKLSLTKYGKLHKQLLGRLALTLLRQIRTQSFQYAFSKVFPRVTATDLSSVFD